MKDLVNETIIRVLKSEKLLCVNDVDFKLTCREDDIFWLTVVSATDNGYSISEYLLRWDDDDGSFVLYSES